jgi:D-arabinose 1-dehydrogenase-like Zn-dependent alcohol dehydrogenase
VRLMKAMVLKRLCNLKENQTPLEFMELPVPAPGDRELLLKVLACGVCHTKLDEIEGRTPPRRPSENADEKLSSPNSFLSNVHGTTVNCSTIT